MRHFIIALILLFASIDLSAACRSQAPVREFKLSHVCPSTGKKSLKCPGFVVDHVCALAQGGKDIPQNMQYQSSVESKAKDRIENTPLGKKKWCNSSNSTKTRQVFNCK